MDSMQVHWTHLSGAGDENGVLAFRVGSDGNGDAISAGGYVSVHTSGSEDEESGASAQGFFPLVETIPLRNSTEDDWKMPVGFAVPHGVNVEAHLWVAVA